MAGTDISQAIGLTKERLAPGRWSWSGSCYIGSKSCPYMCDSEQLVAHMSAFPFDDATRWE
jgi:hypothetical protein